MHLVRAAADRLSDEDVPAAEAAVAIAALVAAVGERLDMAANVGSMLWARIERAPAAPWASDAAGAVGEVADRQLVERIVSALLARSSGRDLREAGLTALAVPHAAALVEDKELLAMAEVVTGQLAYQLVHVILGAAEARQLDPTTARMIAARWRSREDVQARIAAVDLLELLAPTDRRSMAEHVLSNDPAARVRGYAAMKLVDLLPPEQTAEMIDGALKVEEHQDVRADLHRARADLTERHGIGR